MIVVADGSPLPHQILIGAGRMLQRLYGRVLIPQAVAAQLPDVNTTASGPILQQDALQSTPTGYVDSH